MNPPSFFSELKRRNVYKVAIAYAVVSWLLVQVASIVFPAFEAPAATMKILIVLLVVGFPIALGFAWAFEITPEGIKRESEIETDKSIVRRTGRKIVAITAVLAVVAAALLVFQLLRGKTTAPRQSEGATEFRKRALPSFLSIALARTNRMPTSPMVFLAGTWRDEDPGRQRPAIGRQGADQRPADRRANCTATLGSRLRRPLLFSQKK